MSVRRAYYYVPRSQKLFITFVALFAFAIAFQCGKLYAKRAASAGELEVPVECIDGGEFVYTDHCVDTVFGAEE